MKRAPLNLVIDAVAAALLVGMLATGYVIRYPLPRGSHRVLTLWGMHRHQWGEIHFWLSTGLLGLLLVHLALHWTWVMSMVKRHVAGIQAPPRHLLLTGSATLLVLAVSLSLFAWAAHRNVQAIPEADASVQPPLQAEEPQAAPAAHKLESKLSFWHDVYPVFARACLSCHGPKKQLGGFRADQPQDWFGQPGMKALVVPGDSSASPLVDIVSGARPDMPQAERHRLPPDEVDLLKAWIDAGAAWPPR